MLKSLGGPLVASNVVGLRVLAPLEIIS
jgi:hypothetical protein